jgi:glycosyltransferase involved in cell wall biosynthesis
MSNLPSISIIIPTYTSSEQYIEMCIGSIINQDYPKSKLEILVIDNESKDNTINIAKRLGAIVYTVKGKPPQVCGQRNLGAKKAKNEYLLFLDHDMELERGLLLNFSELVNRSRLTIDAWYIPEKIKASSWLLERIRNYERNFYNATIIDAARIIKKSFFLKTPTMYDVSLAQGPADWDMDIQLKLLNCKFGILNNSIVHHEEKMSFLNYLNKKDSYSKGSLIYINKWRNNKKIYDDIVSRQFGAFYRLIGIFVDGVKEKKSIMNPIYYIILIILRLYIGIKFKLNTVLK